jgi:hypothetical protein
MLNFSFRKKSNDNKLPDTKNDQNIAVKNAAPIQASKVEEDIFALAAKEEEERNLDNVVAADTVISNSALETPIQTDVKESENKLPEQLSQIPAPINSVAEQASAPEAINIQTPEQPILEDKKIVAIEAAKPEINTNLKEDESPVIKPAEDANSANIQANVSEEASIQNNQENEINIKAEEVTHDHKKFTHPNDQDPSIWVPQLIEILREMSKEEALAE